MSHLISPGPTSFRHSPAMRLRPLCRAVQLALALGLATASSAGMAAAVIPVAELNGVNGFRLDGVGTSDRSGAAVSGAGDINGDGVGDLIVAAPRYGIYVGGSYVIFGNSSGFASTLPLSSLDGSNGFRLDGVATSIFANHSVSAAGDINGDHIDDIIIGAHLSAPYGIVNAGSSYVVFGRSSGFDSVLALPSLDGSTGFRIDGENIGDAFGFSVSNAGDINDDGIDDVIIGAPPDDPNGINGAGSSYVLFGSETGFSSVLNLSDLNGDNGFRLNGENALDFSGHSVSAAGDINGDQIDDLIIGVGVNADRSYVVFGSNADFPSVMNLADLDGSNGFRLDGEEGSRFGRSVSNAGDINGDGFDDVVIGASRADDVYGSRWGSSYVLFGHGSGFASVLAVSSLDGVNGFRLDGVGALDYSGFSVSGAGDINGDGFDDLIIGAYGANDPNGYSTGSSYVVFGHSLGFPPVMNLADLNGSNGYRLDGSGAGHQFGRSVSAAGDINGDGIDDVIIGAPFASLNATQSGSSYVVFGREEAVFSDGFEN